jgi:DNA-binding transcriptional LysR family regulator
MDISARQSEAFRTVMLTGSITGASEALFVTQPAISRLIQSLESATGLTLFERRGNHVVPTAEATALLVEVGHRQLNQINAIFRCSQLSSSGSKPLKMRGPLRIETPGKGK